MFLPLMCELRCKFGEKHHIDIFDEVFPSNKKQEVEISVKVK